MALGIMTSAKAVARFWTRTRTSPAITFLIWDVDPDEIATIFVHHDRALRSSGPLIEIGDPYVRA
jgi:hypothetical protein